MQTLELIQESPDVDTLESAEPLQLAFAPAQTLLAKWQEKADSLTVTREDQITEMKQARLARLELKDARVALDKTRKKLKEQMHLTVKDGGVYGLYSDKGEHVATINQDYVPNGIVPGSYGDTIELDIGGDGIIKNWPKKPNVDAFFPAED